jgi:DNA end-binding protein Ku
MASTIWKGHLTFGLVSIPVKLFRAARAEKIHMHHLQRETGARVRQVFVPAEDAATDLPAVPDLPPPAAPVVSREVPKQPVATTLPPLPAAREHAVQPAPISRSSMVQGFEYEKDKYVEFEREKLEKIAPTRSTDMQIVEFVHFAEVDPVYLESSYYLAPDSGGEKPYALLFEALRKTGYAAIAEFVMHRRDQTMILRPGRHGIIGHTLFYEDEVKRENEFRADPAVVQAKEMELAVKLVDALAAPFEPEKFKDKYRERLQSAISQKLASGAVKQVETGTRKAPVVDILAALRESLESAKKPAASERKPVAKKGRKAG